MLDQGLLCVTNFDHQGGRHGLSVFAWDGQAGFEARQVLQDGDWRPLVTSFSPDAGVFLSADCGPGGSIASYTIDEASGQLTLVSRRPSGGSVPAGIAVTRSGAVLVVNCGPFAPDGGDRTIAMLQLGADGELNGPLRVLRRHGSGADPTWQSSPHPHSVVLDAAGSLAVVADMGTDELLACRIDDGTGGIEVEAIVSVRSGTGPRHCRFGPTGRYLYVSTEISNEVLSFAYGPEGCELRPLGATSAWPEADAPLGGGADLVIHPSGRWLFTSHRVPNEIGVFAADERSGEVVPVGRYPTGGEQPRGLALDPSGRYLLAGNEGSDTVVGFEVDTINGRLVPLGTVCHTASPASLTFVLPSTA